jgi:uncharacterized protein involved in oxidation of intracellular sulfur
MKYLLILNDAPYGSERSYNGLRLASSLAAAEGTQVSLFLIGDAVSCCLAGQSTPSGYYNIERMLKGLANRRTMIGVCGTCIDARGIKAEYLVQGAKRSSMEELTAWTQESDKVLVF